MLTPLRALTSHTLCRPDSGQGYRSRGTSLNRNDDVTQKKPSWLDNCSLVAASRNMAAFLKQTVLVAALTVAYVRLATTDLVPLTG